MDDDREWIRFRLEWLNERFGPPSRFPVQTPTLDSFPNIYNGSDEAITELFWQVCAYMNLRKSQVKLRLYDFGSGLEGNSHAGYYSGGQPHRVSINTNCRGSQTAMVAVMAHELCHVKLLGMRHLRPDVPDNEPLTDLAAVHFGFGIFMANAKYQVTRRGWQTQGYLPTAQLCFALATVAYLQEDKQPEWVNHLTGGPRSSFKQGMAWLEHMEVVGTGNDEATNNEK